MIASKVMSTYPETTDYLIIGAGVAGLRAAITLAAHGEVLVVTKEALGESNTHYAQGGIAVATEGAEDVSLHLRDTIAAGDGLVNRRAAEVLVREGPLRVEELIAWGANFDRQGGELLRTREAAHSRPRILHAQGDATGAEIGRSLIAFARSHPRIHFAQWTMATGLVVEDGRVVAADLASANPTRAEGSRAEELVGRVAARAVLIATGGAGQVYSDTTNPAVATGDGIALAARAGAELADMEFYQFHPTALSLPGVPRFLLSEALRGEGAYLRNDRGERFMERYHADLELAPRDVVARAIAREGMGENPAESHIVYLDMRHVKSIDLTERFPGISRFLARHDLSLSRDLIPVRPAAHYLMGGIRTDLDGRTNVKGLYAAGEAACTGVHGANRLASNSLLEGLVFGARAAEAMLADGLSLMRAEDEPKRPLLQISGDEILPILAELKTMMWRDAGLLRDEAGLLAGLSQFWPLQERYEAMAKKAHTSRALVEAEALLHVAWMILESAFDRKESRGAHFREDYPKRNDVQFGMHSVVDYDGIVRFEPDDEQ
jgi:L-aspartate oxidase